MTSADGRARVPAGAAAWDYRAALEELSVHTLLGDGTMSNRLLPGAFQAKTRTALGYESFKKMTQSPAYDIVVDERGGLFKDAAEGGKPCLVITAQSAAREYLAFLQSRGISWIASGEDGVDFSRAAEMLRCPELNFPTGYSAPDLRLSVPTLRLREQLCRLRGRCAMEVFDLYVV